MPSQTWAALERVPAVLRSAWKVGKRAGGPSPRDVLLDALPKHAIGAEIGVHRGDFSERLLSVTQPKLLFLIDPWAYETDATYAQSLYGGEAGGDQGHMDDRYAAVRRRFAAEIEAGQVRVLRDTSDNALRAMDDGALDWVYIDGNHLYEYVKADLELAFRKVRPGGVISGDDYARGDWWKGGVKRAVDEFVKARNLSAARIVGRQFLLAKAAA
jgi:hypothetical protein